MKNIGMIAIAAGVLAFGPAQAKERPPTKGVVVIGVVGDVAPDLIWRQFDPSTGKLLPFSVAKNVGTNAKKSVSGLFSVPFVGGNPPALAGKGLQPIRALE